MVMTLTPERVSIRWAHPNDRQQLANLIHFSPYVHRHLDWRPPLDWIGYPPFAVAEQDGRILAALACPADLPEANWVRLFAVSSALRPVDAWNTLWPQVWEYLADQPVEVAAIPLTRWFQNILAQSQFDHTYDVVMLAWEKSPLPQKHQTNAHQIRTMTYDDLAAVRRLDQHAFKPVWQNSLGLLEIAFRQAAFATVAEDKDHGIVGYQLSTASAAGGHLARLAVHPQMQAHGIGYSLVSDLLSQFQRRGATRVTVNTQMDNLASLHLYQKAGFHLTGEFYHVYQILPEDR